MKSKLTVEMLRSEILYNPETGELRRKASNKPVYKELKRGGYRIEVAGERIMAHRAIWAIIYGEFVTPKHMLFVDGDPRNLCLNNLTVPNLEKEKRCPACNLIKPLQAFHRNSQRATMRGSYCKECVKNAGDAAHRKLLTRNRRIESYNITVEEYERLEQQQNNACKICGVSAERVRYKTLVIDHDHSTGAVRGLLCPKCNAAIGLLGDDPRTVLLAAKHLLGE